MIKNSNIFLDSYPIVVKKELAVKYGLNESIVMQQIYYWINHNKKNNQNYLQNRYWTYNTMEAWQKQFPFWCIKTIKTIFDNLQKKNLILSCAPNKKLGNQTKWYTLNLDEEMIQNHTDSFFYLYQSRPINVQKQLAYKIGLTRAVILQQIQYWVEYNKEKNQNFIHEKYWVFQSLENWHKYFPFMSLITVKRIFKSLEEEQIILSGNFHKDKFNKVKWYTINYEHEIFNKSNLTKNPDLSHSVKMIPSEISFLHYPYKYTEKNYLIEKKTRTREEIFLKDFVPNENQIKTIMKANKLTKKELDQALVEFLLKQEELYEGEGEPIYNKKKLVIGFARWCALFPQIKTVQNRTVINHQDQACSIDFEDRIEKWTNMVAKQSNLDQDFFLTFVKNFGKEKFNQCFLYCLKMKKDNDGFVRLFLVDYRSSYYSVVHSNIKDISDSIKGILDEIKGIKLYPSTTAQEPSISINF